MVSLRASVAGLASLACLAAPAAAPAVEGQYVQGFGGRGQALVAAPGTASATSPTPWFPSSNRATTPPTMVLTLPEAVTMAVRQSTGIRAAELGVRAARRDVNVAEAAWLPTIRLNAMLKDSNFSDRYLVLGQVGQLLSDIAADSAAMAGVQVDVPIVTGGALPAAARMAHAGEQGAELQQRLAVQQALYGVIEAYLDALVEKNAVKLEDRKADHKAHEVAMVREKVTERFALGQQVLALELELNEIRQDRLEHSNALRQATGRLLNELSLPPTTPVEVDPRVGLQELPSGLNSVLDRVRRGNIGLQMLLTQVVAAKDKVGYVAAEGKPGLGMVWNYYHTHPFGTDTEAYASWEVKLQGTLKLFDGGQAHNKRLKALEELRKLEVELSSKRRQLELQAEGAYARYEEASRLLTTLDDNITLAKELLRFVEERVAARVLLKTDLLKARVDLLKAQQAKFFVHAALLKARAAIFLLMGELTPDKAGGP